LVRVKVCTESNLVATPYCPETVVSEFERRTQPTMRCTLHGPRAAVASVSVPNVIGFSVDTAQAHLEASGLRIQVRTVSSGMGGIVQWQNPRPGSRTAKSSVVTLGVPVNLSSSGSGVVPVAGFTVSPSSPKAGGAAVFDASPSYDTDGDMAGYAWTFGDGGRGEGETVSHAYYRPGSYKVTLTVWDTAGHSVSKSRTIAVK